MTESDFRAGPSADDPKAQLAAVHTALGPVQDEAKALLGRSDDRKRLGRAAADAYAHTGLGTQAGCQAAIADLAGADALVAKYAALAQFPNARAVALALRAAAPKLRAIVWTKPALPLVFVAVPPGDVRAGTAAATTVRATVRRTGDTTAAAGCGIAWVGLAPDPIVDTLVFAAGKADATAAVDVPAQPGMSAPQSFQLQIQAPLVGLTFGTPAFAIGRLLPPVVGPPPPPPPPPPPATRAPKPLDPAAYATLVDADPGSIKRVLSSLRTGTAVRLAPGKYDFQGVNVPGCIVYAARFGTVTVGQRVQMHAPDSAILNLIVSDGIVLDGDRSRASRCRSGGAGQSVGGVNMVGNDNVLDWCEVQDFQGIGIEGNNNCRRPVIFGIHIHGQKIGPAGTNSMMMIGTSKEASALPIAPYVGRTLVDGSVKHDGVELKTSSAVIEDVTVVGCDLMQRHGKIGLRAVSCWAENGRIQLNDGGASAISCVTGTTEDACLAIVAGTISGDQLRAGTSGYPYAVNAHAEHHRGLVMVGWARPGWNRPPVNSTYAACPSVRIAPGVQAKEIAPSGAAPAPARKLTPGQVGPEALL